MNDGGELNIDWYPPNYNSMDKSIPIVILLLGSFGTCNEPYCKELAI